MNDFSNRNKFSNPNDRVFIWYRSVRISEGVLYLYIFVCMLRIDRRNWTIPKADFWYTGVTFSTVQQGLVLDQNFNITLSYDVIVTFSVM